MTYLWHILLVTGVVSNVVCYLTCVMSDLLMAYLLVTGVVCNVVCYLTCVMSDLLMAYFTCDRCGV